jgi:hypothetical protein
LFAQKKRTKEKGTRYFLHPKLTLLDGVVDNSLRSNNRLLNPSNKLNFWRQYNGMKSPLFTRLC